MSDPHLGEAGSQVVLEAVLSGAEASVVVVTDGVGFQTIASVRDYKRLMDGGRGPNTGGMGCHGPAHNLEPWMKRLPITRSRRTL